MAADRQQRVP